MEKISTLISMSYQLSSKSQDITSICKQQALIYDCLWGSRCNRIQHSCGSTSEGLYVSGSDVDRMEVDPEILVLMSTDFSDKVKQKNQVGLNFTGDGCRDMNTEVLYELKCRTNQCLNTEGGKANSTLKNSEFPCTTEIPSSSQIENKNVFYTDQSRSRPGYTMLTPTNRNSLNHRIFGNFEYVLEDKSFGVFLSSKKFIQFMLSRQTPIEPKKTQPSFQHGPCVAIAHDNIYGYAVSSQPGVRLHEDIAFALRCDEWPIDTHEWDNRQQRYDWPGPELIEKIKQLPCYCVAIGDQTSEQFDLEWRISFLLAELELIWNFNDTQIQCTVILKRLFKTFIETLATDQITSYHIKMAVLWLSEKQGLGKWKDMELLERVQDCLDYLVDCIKEEKLPHYLQRERNLLQGKFPKVSEKQQVMSKLLEIRGNVMDIVLTYAMPENDILTKLWLVYGNVDAISTYLDAMVINKFSPRFFNLVKKVNDARKTYQAISNISVNLTDACDNLNMLQKLRETLSASSTIREDFKTPIKHFMDILIGLRYYEKALDEGNVTVKASHLAETKKYLEHGTNFDTFTGKLYLASFYFCEQEYKKVVELISGLLSRKQYLVYTGRCSTNYGIELGMTDDKILMTSEVPVVEDIHHPIFPAYDFVFSKVHLRVLPYPLKLECVTLQEIGERFIVIHPCVYAYCLLFSAQHFVEFTKEKDQDYSDALSTLEKMKETINDTGDNIQRYRALNLLGFCYLLCIKEEEAVECFGRSIRESSRLPNIKNAAPIYICMTVFHRLLIKAVHELEIFTF